MNDNQKIDIFKHKFGVEIEMTGISIDKTVWLLKEYFKDRNKLFHCAKDNQGRKWIAKGDGTINKEGKNGGGVELVTPILEYGDIKTLKEIIIKLRKAGAIVNKSCGLHIHVDGTVHTSNSVKRLLNDVITHQEMLYKALNVYKNRRVLYCEEIYIKELKKIIDLSPPTLGRIGEVAYQKNKIVNLGHLSDNKYARNNTIEFRIFNSTLNEDEAEAYIKLCLALSTKAINGPDSKNPDLEYIEINHETPPASTKEKVLSMIRPFKIINQKSPQNDINKTDELQYDRSNKNNYKRLYGLSQEPLYLKTRLWFMSMGIDPMSIEQLTKNLHQHNREAERTIV